MASNSKDQVEKKDEEKQNQELDPREVKAMELYLLGEALREVKNYAEAEQAFRSAIALSDTLASESWNGLGRLYLESGALDQAEACLTNSIRLCDSAAAPYMNMGLVMAARGKYQLAVSFYEKARERDGLIPEIPYNMGLAFSAYSMHELAVRSYQLALQLDARLVEAHFNMGNSLRLLGRLEEALQAYRKAAAIRPAWHDIWNNMGLTLSLQQNFTDAELCFRKGLSIKPDDIKLYINLGNALTSAGKTETAIAVFGQALNLCPEDPEVLVSLGLCYADRNSNGESLPFYEKAARINPALPLLFFNYGMSLYRLSRFEESCAAFRREIINQPDHGRSHLMVSYVLEELGAREESQKHYKVAVRLEPHLLAAPAPWEDTSSENEEN